MNRFYSVLDAIDHLGRVRAGIFAILVIVSLLLVLQISIIISLRAMRFDIALYRMQRRNDLNPSAAWGEAREKSLVEGQTTLPSGL